MNRDVLCQIQQTVSRWINSDEGRAAIAEMLEQMQRQLRDLQEAEKVDPETMRRPTSV